MLYGTVLEKVFFFSLHTAGNNFRWRRRIFLNAKYSSLRFLLLLLHSQNIQRYTHFRAIAYGDLSTLFILMIHTFSLKRTRTQPIRTIHTFTDILQPFYVAFSLIVVVFWLLFSCLRRIFAVHLNFKYFRYIFNIWQLGWAFYYPDARETMSLPIGWFVFKRCWMRSVFYWNEIFR